MPFIIKNGKYYASAGSNVAENIIYDNTESGLEANDVQGAINELNSNLDNISTDIETCFQSVSNGKTLLASAITDKGVTTAQDATFETMATNISNISGINNISLTEVHAKKGLNTAFTSTYTASASGTYMAVCFSAGNTSSNTTSVTTSGGSVIFQIATKAEDSGQTHITIMFVKLNSGNTVTGKQPDATSNGRAAFVVYKL